MSGKCVGEIGYLRLLSMCKTLAVIIFPFMMNSFYLRLDGVLVWHYITVHSLLLNYEVNIRQSEFLSASYVHDDICVCVPRALCLVAGGEVARGVLYLRNVRCSTSQKRLSAVVSSHCQHTRPLRPK